MGYAFISYSTQNQQAADAMRNLLTKEGIKTWMAPGDIPAGSRYAQVINQAIRGCSCFILILSKDSQNSVWVAKEVERAVNYRKLIIPVQIEDVILNDEFELYLSTDQLIAIQKLDTESTEVRKLLESVVAAAGRELAPEAAVPAVSEKRSDEIIVKVIGVGGAGNNAVIRMRKENISGVELICMNTDQQRLSECTDCAAIQIGERVTKGLGAGGRPEIGEQAARESIETIRQAISGADMVFITCGLGGGTGTGAAPVIASAAKEMGILTVGTVSMPFRFESSGRKRCAEEGLERMKSFFDTLIVIYNDRLLAVADRGLTMSGALALSDETLCQCVHGVSDLLFHPGVIKVEFDDLRRVIKDKGLAYIGTGVASGSERMEEAARKAIRNPLIGTGIGGAESILVNLTGSSSMSVMEVNRASAMITEAAGSTGDILFGTAIDDTMGDTVRVMIIATGICE